MGCSYAASVYLQVLNIIVLICALGIVIATSVTLKDVSDFKDALTTFPIYGPLVFGLILALVAIVGQVGARTKNKCLLLIYVIVTFLVTMIVLASGAGILVYGGFLDDVRGAEASIKLENDIQDFELAVYTKCCVARFSDVNPAVACADNGNANPCIHDELLFTEFEQKISQKTCDQLNGAFVFDEAIVAEPVSGGCGLGDPQIFVFNISQFFLDNINTLGIANLVLAVIMLLDLIASCCLLCAKKEVYTKEQKVKEMGEAKAGSELATGTI